MKNSHHATDILKVTDLGKTYKSFRKEPGLRGAFKALVNREIKQIEAVRPISFTIKKGEFVGLLGPNGAGKTTILKMLTGLITPSCGSAVAFGTHNTSERSPEYLERVGLVMGQRNQLNPDLPAIDSFKLSQAIYGVSKENFDSILASCTEMFQNKDLIEKPVRKLSLGERMQMELTLSLLHRPEILFLDEPTIGLDFVAAEKIRRFLAKINQEFGVTIILTSHYTKDIEQLCKRVILINRGTKVYDGPLRLVDERIQGQRDVSIVLRTDPDCDPLIGAIETFTDKFKIERSADDHFTLTLNATPRAVPEILKSIFQHIKTHDIHDIKIADTSLEEVFSDIYRNS